MSSDPETHIVYKTFPVYHHPKQWTGITAESGQARRWRRWYGWRVVD